MGFSLIETVVATGIVIAVALGVAQLFAVTTDVNRRAAMQTSMTLFAVQKMEQLRTGEAAPLVGVEHLDSGGDVVPAAAAVYVRRWSIEPLASDPSTLLILQVIVTCASRPIDARIVGVRRRGD
ncbi:MAG: type IV pilus modification PilV family protein [Vicinamibacterales bacterium]